MKSKTGVFITGTGTDVGKTICSSLLVSHLLQSAEDVGYWKPIQTGLDSDRNTVLTLTGLPMDKAPLPSYEFPEPVAPARAAALHHTPINLQAIQCRWDELPSDRFWIVEGAGGLLVPLNGQETIADLILALRLPVIVVANTRLGTMNHLLLTLEAFHHRRIRVQGILWVGDEDAALATTLEPWLKEIPFQRRIPLRSQINTQVIHELAQELSLTSELREENHVS